MQLHLSLTPHSRPCSNPSRTGALGIERPSEGILSRFTFRGLHILSSVATVLFTVTQELQEPVVPKTSSDGFQDPGLIASLHPFLTFSLAHSSLVFDMLEVPGRYEYP